MYWLKLLAGIVLVVVLFRKINRSESILEAFRVTEWFNIIFCGLLLIPNILLAFLKWRYLLKNRFETVTGREVFGSLLFGYTLGLITPGRLGELGRGLFFMDKDKFTVTGLNVLDKVLNQVAFFTLGGAALALFIFNQNVWEAGKALPLLVAGGGILLLLWILILTPSLVKKMLRRLSRRFAANSKIHSLMASYDNITPKDSLVVLSLSFLWVFVIAYQYHILVLAFTPVSWWESLQAVNATLLVKTLLPFTVGDLGIREGIALFFYSQFGVSPAAVFNASLLVFLINFLIPALSGIYYVFQLRELKNGRAEVSPEKILPAPYSRLYRK